jgi:site-specific recombinase XerD
MGIDNADNPAVRLDRELQKIRDNSQNGDLDPDLARRLIGLANALDSRNPRDKYIAPNGEHKEYAPGTIYQYISVLLRWRDLDGIDYLTADAKQLNDLAADMDTGFHPNSKEGGYSRQTVNKFLCAAKCFYQYHDDLGVKHGDIDMFKKANTPAYDDRDMFTREEISALRDEMPDPRWRAILEMLIFTGQRLHALTTLRVKDIDAENGVYYLNDEEYGLKGADKRGLKRPLLGARRYIQDWLQYHPRGDDPEAYVFIGDPSNSQTRLDRPITERSIRRGLKKYAEQAGIKKSVKPHKMRHYFVTVMKRDHGFDDDEIKFLLGHSKDSNVMATTYQHISNEDYIKSTEEKIGIRDEDDASPVTPGICPVCGRTLKPNDRACSACGELVAADAKATKDQVHELMIEELVNPDLSEEEQDAMKNLIRKFGSNESTSMKDVIYGMLNEDDY